MTLPVYHHDCVIDELEAHFLWWASQRSLDEANRWIDGFEDAIESLGQNPRIHGIAPENSEFPFEVRQLLFGLGSKPTHRALYTIRPDMIYVLLIRHVSQRPVTIDDLD